MSTGHFKLPFMVFKTRNLFQQTSVFINIELYHLFYSRETLCCKPEMCLSKVGDKICWHIEQDILEQKKNREVLVLVADGEKRRGGHTLVGVLSSWEQSSDVESRSSSEELMKHRPQGSLGDSSCQDWREERGNVHTRARTHRWVSKDTQQVSGIDTHAWLGQKNKVRIITSEGRFDIFTWVM